MRRTVCVTWWLDAALSLGGDRDTPGTCIVVGPRGGRSVKLCCLRRNADLSQEFQLLRMTIKQLNQADSGIARWS